MCACPVQPRINRRHFTNKTQSDRDAAPLAPRRAAGLGLLSALSAQPSPCPIGGNRLPGAGSRVAAAAASGAVATGKGEGAPGHNLGPTKVRESITLTQVAAKARALATRPGTPTRRAHNMVTLASTRIPMC